jgi:endonuclease/exonuclease/phosphatase family metal-dependent hydrolase
MKIATWNIERLKKKSNLNAIKDEISKINADILVLTEHHKLLQLPEYKFFVETDEFSADEIKVGIYSKYPIKRTIETYDKFISCCAEFETPYGNLIIYGTVVGVLGNRNKNYLEDVRKQTEDIQKISKEGNFCYLGDLNMSFSDNYYYTKIGRKLFTDYFLQNSLNNLTESIIENIDHIIINQEFIKNCHVTFYEWNTHKILSDHKGICVEIGEK